MALDVPAFAGRVTLWVTVPPPHDGVAGNPGSDGLTEIEHVDAFATAAVTVTVPPSTLVGPAEVPTEVTDGAGTASTVTVVAAVVEPAPFFAVRVTA